MVTEVDDEDGLTTVIEFRDILSIAAGERARYATDENQRRPSRYGRLIEVCTQSRTLLMGREGG